VQVPFADVARGFEFQGDRGEILGSPGGLYGSGEAKEVIHLGRGQRQWHERSSSGRARTLCRTGEGFKGISPSAGSLRMASL